MRLADNPYCLVPLMSWTRLDKLGIQLLAEAGVEDPRRDRRHLVGAVDEIIKRILKEDATAVTDADLCAALGSLLSTRKGELIDAAVSAGRDNIAIVPGRDGSWRAPGAAAMEDELLARLRRMAQSTVPHRSPALLPRSIRALIKEYGLRGVNSTRNRWRPCSK